MFKKTLIALTAIAISTSAMANIEVTVINKSKIYDLELKGKDVQASIYSINPEVLIAPLGTDTFTINSLYPDVVRLADLDYGYDRYGPKCSFRFTIIKDWRTGKMLPQNIISSAEGGNWRDRARCTGTLDEYNFTTGEARVTFTIDRRKF